MTIFLDKKRKINEEIQKGKSMMKGMKRVWDIGLALKVVQEVALSKISRRISKNRRRFLEILRLISQS
ncbi:hypothetical protein F521_02165 [Enterococcus hirae 67-03-C5]|nr:hypothetical protein F521_02165 [Enterococcus hirae 67-03-C5]